MNMIEESRKRNNQELAHCIVDAANKAREKRQLTRPKKDFMTEHTDKVRFWQEIKRDEQ